jgi:hypothetical protein
MKQKVISVALMTDAEILIAFDKFVNLPPVNRLVVTHDPKFLIVKFT